MVKWEKSIAALSSCCMLMLTPPTQKIVVCADIKNRFANGSWEEFNEILDSTPPLNGEQCAL